MLTLSEAQKMFKVYPRTNKALSVWEMANILNVTFNIKQTSQGILWSLNTGRLTGTAEMTIRKLSSYQQLKLLVDVVNSTNLQSEVPSFLNERFS